MSAKDHVAVRLDEATLSRIDALKDVLTGGEHLHQSARQVHQSSAVAGSSHSKNLAGSTSPATTGGARRRRPSTASLGSPPLLRGRHSVYETRVKDSTSG